jgi:hypothetical protein
MNSPPFENEVLSKLQVLDCRLSYGNSGTSNVGYLTSYVGCSV